MSDGELLNETPSQTAGPYVHIGCVPNTCGVSGVFAEDLGKKMYREGCEGHPITIRGCLWDSNGAPITDAMIEFWQAGANGLYPGNDPGGPADQNFGGFGRVVSESDSGEWAVQTIKPGSVPFPDGRMQAPHITVWIVARGINTGLHTRIYFSDEDNSADPVLTKIQDPSRVSTLIATIENDGTYRFDIRIQGDQETVFFDV